MDIIIRQMDIKDIGAVKIWLENKDNHVWLDSAFHRDIIDEKLLVIMLLKKSNKTYVFQIQNELLGIVGLADVDTKNNSGRLWYMLGENRYARRGVTTQAVKMVLRKCFKEFGLHSINSWAVAENRASCRIMEKVGFKLIGRQRECHLMENVYKDRLIYDVTKDTLVE